MIRKAHVNWIVFENTFNIFYPDDFQRCWWQLLRLLHSASHPVDWLQGDNKFNYSPLFEIFQYQFLTSLTSYYLLNRKPWVYTIKFFLRTSLSSSHVLYTKMHVTPSFRYGMYWIFFHTSEVFPKQMFLFKHKLLLGNFIVLYERKIRWKPMAWFCRKPEMITLNLP